MHFDLDMVSDKYVFTVAVEMFSFDIFHIILTTMGNLSKALSAHIAHSLLDVSLVLA